MNYTANTRVYVKADGKTLTDDINESAALFAAKGATVTDKQIRDKRGAEAFFGEAGGIPKQKAEPHKRVEAEAESAKAHAPKIKGR